MADIECKSIIKSFTTSSGEVTAVDSVDLSIHDGEFVSIVGPSGCGKTTLLRMIAGLETPSSGQLIFDDKDVTDVRPQNRNVSMVFQNIALFPFKSIRENIAYGLKHESGFGKEEINQKVEQISELLDISEQLDNSPGQLSGGQRQRAALGRALIRDPAVFLLDEPMSDLDAKLKIQMRAELKTLHKEFGTTFIYVTHDQEEAMTLSDRVIVMNQGEVEQIAPPDVVFNQPTNLFVARFIGSPTINTFSVQLDEQTITGSDLTFQLPASQAEHVRSQTNGKELVIGVRPSDLRVCGNGEDAILSGKTRIYEQMGDHNLLYLSKSNEDGDIRAKIPPHFIPDDGQEFDLTFDLPDVYFFHGETGEAIENQLTKPKPMNQT